MSKGDYKDGEQSKEESVQGAAEGTWLAQPAEEKTESKAHHRHPLPPKGQHLLSVTRDRTQGNGTELCQAGFRLDIGKGS